MLALKPMSVKDKKKLPDHVVNYIVSAEELAKNNRGKLPSPKWLASKGLSTLYKYITDDETAELFLHIPREYERKHGRHKGVEEHVKMAKSLSSKNGGFIPNCAWLKKNRHAALYECMRLNPKAFKKFKVDRILRKVDRKTAEQHFEDACNVATSHGKKLTAEWMKIHKARLWGHIQKYPKKYNRIKIGGKTLYKHLQESMW